MSFSPHDYARRHRAVLGLLAERHGVQRMVCTSSANVRYLTGFAGSAGVVLVEPDRIVLITDGRYERAALGLSGCDVVIDRDWCGAVSTMLAGTATGIESESMTVSAHARLSDKGLAMVAADDCLSAVRERKEPSEAERLIAACEITDAALAQVLPLIRVGMTERDVSRLLHDAMRDLGADGLAFAPIVAAGPHGAEPHHAPCTRPMSAGELITMDFGALVDGYHADMTRTVCIGAPSQRQRDVHGLVEAAQRAARAACEVGVGLKDLDTAARELIEEAGHGSQFPHGLGHGVGLQIHEAPMVGPRSTGTLGPCVPLTIEPGVYLPDQGGVRIEDTLWVDDSGARALTAATRELLSVG